MWPADLAETSWRLYVSSRLTMAFREYIRLVQTYWAASDEHTRLRASLEGSRGKLQLDQYRQLAAEVEEARVVMEQAKSELAIHLALHGHDEARQT